MDGLKEGSRLATGSVPQVDPESAVRFQLSTFPEIPAWPQMPKKSPRERILRQGLSGLPGLAWPTPDQPIWNLEIADLPKTLEILRAENAVGNTQRAVFTADEAEGLNAFLKTEQLPDSTLAVKGQCVGPMTLGWTIHDHGGKPLLASRPGMEVLAEYLLMHARDQAARLAKLGKPVVLFLDEPLMGASSVPKTVGWSWPEVHALYASIMEPLQEEGVILGIHCCGSGPWGWVYDTPAELFHFDAFQYLSNIVEDPIGLGRYLHQGGSLVWGMVPTSMVGGVFPEPAVLCERWMDAFHELVRQGVSRDELIGRSLFSTSCGLGGGTVDCAEKAGRCLADFQSLWRTRVQG